MEKSGIRRAYIFPSPLFHFLQNVLFVLLFSVFISFYFITIFHFFIFSIFWDGKFSHLEKRIYVDPLLVVVIVVGIVENVENSAEALRRNGLRTRSIVENLWKTCGKPVEKLWKTRDFSTIFFTSKKWFSTFHIKIVENVEIQKLFIICSRVIEHEILNFSDNLGKSGKVKNPELFSPFFRRFSFFRFCPSRHDDWQFL